MRLTLQKKIFAITGILVGLFFIVITIFAVSQVTNLVEETEHEQYNVLVESIEGRLEQEIENTRVSVLSIANIPEV